jgi:hypothetical protein
MNKILAVDLLAGIKSFSDQHLKPFQLQINILAWLLLITYGFQAFNLLLAGDDWVYIHFAGIHNAIAVRMGRWLRVLIWDMPSNNTFAPAFTLGVGLFFLAFSSWLAAHFIRMSTNWANFFFCALFLVFPIWAEPLSFKGLQVSYTLAVAFSVGYGAVALTIARRLATKGVANKPRLLCSFLGAGMLTSLGPSIHQGSMFFGAMIFGLGLMNDWVNQASIINLRTVLRSYASTIVFVVMLGMVFYVGEVGLSTWLLGVEPSHGGAHYSVVGGNIDSIDSLLRNVARMKRYLAVFLFHGQHLFPAFLKYLFLVALFFLILTLAVKGDQKSDKKGSVIRTASLFCILAVLFLVPWSLGIVRVSAPYRYNAIVGLAVLYAGVFAMLIEHGAPLVRSLAVFMATVLVVGFAFQHNVAATLMYVNNLRDYAVTQQIVTRIQSHAEYSKLPSKERRLPVIFVGKLSNLRGRPFTEFAAESTLMGGSIVKCGVYTCQPYRFPEIARLIQSTDTVFVSRNWQWPVLREDLKAKLRPLVHEAEVWPAESSVFPFENTFVVVFSKEEV